MSFLRKREPGQIQNDPARSFPITVTGYDTSSPDITRHAVLGTRKDTGQAVRIEYLPSPTKEGDKPRRDIASFTGRDNKSVAIGGEILVEGAFPVTGQNTHRARWLTAVKHRPDDPSHAQTFVAALHVSRDGRPYVEALTPGAQPVVVTSAGELEAYLRKYFTKFAARQLGLPFVLVRGYDPANPTTGGVTRINAGAPERDQPNTPEAEVERAMKSVGMAKALEHIATREPNEVIEVQGAIRMFVGKESAPKMPVSLFSEEQSKADGSTYQRSKGFTEVVIGLHWLGESKSAFCVKSLRPTSSPATFDPLGRNLLTQAHQLHDENIPDFDIKLPTEREAEPMHFGPNA